jgi:hypothetical protein
LFHDEGPTKWANISLPHEDSKIGTEEVKAKKQILEADALRILSTWPWHAASGNASTPTAK